MVMRKPPCQQPCHLWSILWTNLISWFWLISSNHNFWGGSPYFCHFLGAKIWCPGLLVEWLTRLTYNPKRVSEWVQSRPGHIQKLVNKLWIQRGSVGRMRLKTVVPCNWESMPGQVKDPTRWTVACSGLHTSGKNPIGLRRRVMSNVKILLKFFSWRTVGIMLMLRQPKKNFSHITIIINGLNLPWQNLLILQTQLH
jgi:hypothetical protein